MEEVKNVRGAEPVHIDSLKATQPLPEKKAHVPDHSSVPNKKSVLLVWILSAITLNIYSGIWYMKKVGEFLNLGTKKRLNNSLPTTLLVINIALIAAILIFPITITESMGTFYQRVTPLQQAIVIAIMILAVILFIMNLVLSFRARSIINEALYNKGSRTKVSALFTIIFSHVYLQYEINKIIDDKEDTPKIGPWVFLLIILVLIALGIAIPSFM